MAESEYHVMVYCTVCNRRLIDKLSPSEGTIRVKCPHCNNLITINLAFRKNTNYLKYRISKSA